jgi:myo-inositol 2-dehydrogenase / D-chiro-inositol 1-dehydrogenase
MSVRVGVIGVGAMGGDHARILVSQVPGATLRALYDANPARARTVADETGAQTIAADPLDLIRDPAIDAVLVASPDGTHKELAVACIACRKPVLCEKPLAPTSRECLEVVAAETKLGCRLAQVGYMRRFDPSYVEMKSELLAGGLGKALMLHCVHRNVSAPAWFDGKMAISNSAVHEFDIARWILDTEFTLIQVFRPEAVSLDSPGAPVFLVLETMAGHITTIEIFNDAKYGYDVRSELVCERGAISLRAPVYTDKNFALTQSVAYPADWRPRFADAYRLQAQAWISAVRSGVSAGATAWDGYAAAQVSEAGLLSLAEKRAVRIELDERPAIYDAP